MMTACGDSAEAAIVESTVDMGMLPTVSVDALTAHDVTAGEDHSQLQSVSVSHASYMLP